MRRLFRALLLPAVLGAFAAGAFLALGRPDIQANPNATITVNSTADNNTRDSVMTLREAILLARSRSRAGCEIFPVTNC